MTRKWIITVKVIGYVGYNIFRAAEELVAIWWTRSKASNIIMLKSHHRLLPVGFTPVAKSYYEPSNKNIEKILASLTKEEKGTYRASIEEARKLINYVYKTFKKDDDSVKFIEQEEFDPAMEYFVKDNKEILIQPYRNMNLSKYKRDGVKLQDSPDTASTHLRIAKNTAEKLPVLMLFQENGADESWGKQSILVASTSCT